MMADRTEKRKMCVCGLAVHWEYVLSLLLGLMAIFSLTEAKEMFHSGRNVCINQRQRAQPVPYRQSYRRAVYRQSMQMCENFRVCSRLTLAYQTAYRTVFHMQIRTHFVHGCCPGWQQASPRDKKCTKPVCGQACKNGGTCEAPGQCTCPEGWTGPFCQKDVDECAGSNKCLQVCQNLPGSYECSCQDGYKIAKDQVSCTLCLSCMSEFKVMMTTIAKLTSRVEELETEKDVLMTNLTSMATHYDEVMYQMQAAQAAAVAATTTTTTTTDKTASTTAKPDNAHTSNNNNNNNNNHDMDDYGDMMDNSMMPGFDRLASLSNQISLLEERMADCTCWNYGDNNNNNNKRKRS